MKRTISKAESFSRTLRGQNEEMKQDKLYTKYGNILGIETCNRIAKDF